MKDWLSRSGINVHLWKISVLLVPLTLVMLFPSVVTAQEMGEEFPDAKFFVGDYTLIGKVLNGNDSFIGKLQLEVDSSGLQHAQRIIGTDTTICTWGMEYAIGAEVRVIRVRWERATRKYECTYQWSMDFDNYPRLSGHCYESGKTADNPGMEVGFIIWPDTQSDEDR